MKIVCLGDSLTQGDYGVFGKRCIPNVHPENYPYFLSEILNCEVVNYGKCGFTSSDFINFYNSGAVDVKGADIIIIMLGTNGGLDPEEETQGNIDYIELIKSCKRDEPNAKIVVCTPPHVTSNPEMSNCGYKERVDNATAFVRIIADKQKLTLIDIANYEGFSAETEGVMQPNDGLHFGELGYKTLATFIAEELMRKSVI